MQNWTGMDEFVAVATTGSFSAGAKTLGTSTTRMSRIIAQFESRLQAQLFDRTTRSVTLTDTGRAILDQCRRLLQERDEVLASVTAQGEPRGELRVTCSTAMGERFVAPIMRQYAMAHPELIVSLDLTNRIVDLIGEGYDLAIRTGQLSDSRLIATRVASRAFLTCASPDYLKSAPPITTVSDLTHHECLMGTSATWRFRQGDMDIFHKPDGRWRCNSGTTVVEAALAGMGICQLPEFYVLKLLDEGRLQLVLEDFRPTKEPIWAVYPQRRHLVPKIQGALKSLRRELAHAIAQT